MTSAKLGCIIAFSIIAVVIISLIVIITWIAPLPCQSRSTTSVFDVNGEEKFCGYTDRLPNKTCPPGTEELFRDVRGDLIQTRFCCDPEHESFDEAKNVSSKCRLSPCQPPNPTASICDALDARFINNGTIQLEYEKVLRESCRMNSVIAQCCVKDSPQSYLASTLGAEPNEFPHMVKLRLPWGDCGGTVYNNRFVITAAHCIVNRETRQVKEPEGIQLILGTNMGEAANNKYIYGVKRLIPHPNYDKLRGHSNNFSINDIALVELDREIQFGRKVKALEIAPKGFIPIKYADKAVRVGWGTTTITSDSSVPLHKSNLLIREDDTCFGKWYFAELNGFEDQLMCLGGIFGGRWSSISGKGDSGGPAICRGPYGTALLCGVSSFGVSVDKCKVNSEQCVPSVYAEVAYFHDWINEVAGEQDPVTLYKPYLYGELSKPSKYPHQVHIFSAHGKSCGGTLIRPDVVVTAAHCIMDGEGLIPHEGLRLHVTVQASNNLTGPCKITISSFGISDLEVHPGFQMLGTPINVTSQGNHIIATDNFYANDLALIKLNGKMNISLTKLPLLPKADHFAGTGMELAFQYQDKRQPTVELRSHQFTILTKTQCESRMNRFRQFGLVDNVNIPLKSSDHLLCGVEVYSGGSTCDRELGGGLICAGKDGSQILCGIPIFWYCESSIPNLFIDMRKYTKWIEDTLGKWDLI